MPRDYTIVCTLHEMADDHTHIGRVGTGSGAQPDLIWTVEQVYAAMDRGETFYTVGGGVRGEVGKATCSACEAPSLRTKGDAAVKDNLAVLPHCGDQRIHDGAPRSRTW